MHRCHSAELLLCLGAVSLGSGASGCVMRALGGDFAGPPTEWSSAVSPAAQALVRNAYTDVQKETRVDHHVHIVGLGAQGTGLWVNPAMRSWSAPMRRLRFFVYLDAAGIVDEAAADQQYIARLVTLAENLPVHSRLWALAFDRHYEPDGSVNEALSEFYVPNEYVFDLADKHPELFVPVMSVNPYRKDAIAEVERWAARGGRAMKWLPNAMGIDPADPQLDPFYDRLRALGITLLSHAGEEKAVEAEEDQKLGNPLRLRRALDHGVRVIVAHCASLGEDEDLDRLDHARRPSFELFLRMLDEPRYRGLLYGEISAMTQANRLGVPLTTVLDRTDLHDRLVSGSDYPLPAINVVIRTGALADAGYVNEAERSALNELYAYNPLLFDFVLKRTVRSPERGRRFSAGVFGDLPAAPTTAPGGEVAAPAAP